MDNLDRAEEFLIVRMGERHPEIPISRRFRWAMNYNLEKEVPELFNSDDYDNQEDRAFAMFPGMPEDELKMISLLMYKHRTTDHGEDYEEEIKRLESEIKDPELLEMVERKWWLS